MNTLNNIKTIVQQCAGQPSLLARSNGDTERKYQVNQVQYSIGIQLAGNTKRQSVHQLFQRHPCLPCGKACLPSQIICLFAWHETALLPDSYSQYTGT